MPCFNDQYETLLLGQFIIVIVFLQQSVNVGETVEYFSCDLGIWYNPLIPIILQCARAEEKPFADLPTCEIDFSPPEERRVRLGNLPNASTYFLNARDELLHLGRFFVYDFVFHSHCIFRYDFSRSASRSSLE